jgi:hypothetical protein
VVADADEAKPALKSYRRERGCCLAAVFVFVAIAVAVPIGVVFGLRSRSSFTGDPACYGSTHNFACTNNNGYTEYCYDRCSRTALPMCVGGPAAVLSANFDVIERYCSPMGTPACGATLSTSDAYVIKCH